MKKTIRIGVAQINSVVGDLGGNASRIFEGLDRARGAQCDWVLFPELTITGYPPEDLLFKRHFTSGNLAALDKVKAQTRGLSAVVGFVDRDSKGRLYNAAAVFTDRRLAGVYHKICLPNYGVFDEARYFTPGEKALVLRTKEGARIAVSICEDLWPAESAYIRAVKGARFDALLNLSASPYHFEKQRVREALMKSRARGMKTHLFYANLIGGQDELVFDGASLVYDPAGRKLAGGARFKEDFFAVDVPFSAAGKAGGGIGPKKPLPKRPADPKPENPVREIYDALCLGTRDYVKKNGFQKVLIGTSGGVDSALVAAVAVDAVGKDNVILVSMPSRFSSGETQADVKRLADNLGAQCMEIPIEPLRHAYLKTLETHFTGRQHDTTEENLQARIRGNLLMALSNKFGHLVLTTGNKSEMATGYCTLYGDMAGGFAVIKDVPKTRVYELSRYRNQLAGKALIPESILMRPPTAELRHDQKDSDSLPEYGVLDPILLAYVEKDLSAEEIIAKGFPSDVVRKVVRLVDCNEYKRRQAPPGVKITPKAFGRDRRMPLTNRFCHE